MRYIKRASANTDPSGHTAPITSVEWAPDGSALATGSYDGFAIIWDGEGFPKIKLSHPRLVNGIRWSRASSQLATSCGDGHCYIWNALTGQLVHVLSRHTDDVNAIAWSPSGTYVATASEDGTGRIWSILGNELLETVLVHSDHCMSIDWHPSNLLITTCGEDATIRSWDITGKLLSDWKQPNDLEMIRWSADGSRLAAACDDGSIRILSNVGELVTILGPSPAAVKSVAWSPNGETIASGCYDGSISIWDIQTGESLTRYRTARLWPRSIHWCHTSNRIAIGSQDGIPAIVIPGDQRGAQVSPVFQRRLPTQGVNTISAVQTSFACGLDDGTVRLWSPGEGKVIETYVFGPNDSSLVNAVQGHPTKSILAFGCFSGELGILSGDGSLMAKTNVTAPINSVAWNPDGVRVAAADYSGHISLFEWHDNALSLIRSFKPHDAAIKSIAWLSSDCLVTGSTDRTIRVVSDLGRTELVLRGHGNLINWVSVTKNAERLLIASASRDRTVRIWDPELGTCQRILVGHTESVKSVVWEPGSTTRLASGSFDFDIRVWDAASDQGDSESSRVVGYHSQGVGALEWTHLGLVSGSWDSSVSLWDVGKQDAVTQLASMTFERLQ